MSGPAVPSRIGRYAISERLGQGAMGVVYRGRDEGLDRDVAVKVVRGESLDDESRAQFLKEARAAARLQHSGIVTIYELGEHADAPFLAMELLHGQDLQRAMRAGAMADAARALAIVEQVLAALGHAHARGIVHRDMKPSNVFLHEGVHVKILDFGVARLAGNLTQTGRIVGTPHYMSPEQIRAEAVDGRADLFSTALMFYEMVTGAKAYRQGSDISVMFQIVHSDADLSKLPRTAVGLALRQVLRRALARDRNERYPDAGALSLALSAAVYTPDDGSFVDPGDPEPLTAISGIPELDEPLQEATPLPPYLRDPPAARAAPIAPPTPTPAPPSTSPASFVAPDAPVIATGPSGLPLRMATAPAEDTGAIADHETVLETGPVLPASDWALGTSPPRSDLRPVETVRADTPRSGRFGIVASVAVVIVVGGVVVWWLSWIQGQPNVPSPVPVADSVPTSLAPADAPIPATTLSAASSPPLTTAAEPTPVTPPVTTTAATLAPSSAPVVTAPRAQATVRPSDAPRPLPFGEMDVQGRLDRANRLYEAGQLGAALADARAVLRIQPANEEAKFLVDDIELDLKVEQHLKAARAALARGDREAARREASAGLTLKPNESRLGALLREIDQ